MKVAVCFNRAAHTPVRGEAHDSISEADVEIVAHAVADALRQLGHIPALIPLETEIVSFSAKLQLLRPALVFNLCEGFCGESDKELHVAALFELLGLTYTGASPMTLGLTRDKGMAKDLLVRHGLPTPDYERVAPGKKLTRLKSNQPLIVKPCCEDASLSITRDSVVTNESDLKKRIRYIHEHYRQAALVEEFIFGREFNVAVLGSNPTSILPVAEISFDPKLSYPIVSYEGKWLEKSSDYAATTPVCPAAITKKEHAIIEKVVLTASSLFSCRDYTRVDIRWRNGIPYILELNANPDIAPDAGFARAAGSAGIGYPALINRILNMALSRKGLTHATA